MGVRKNNPQGEFIDMVQKIAEKAVSNSGGGQVQLGTLREDGKITVGESIIEKDDYHFFTQKITIDGQSVTIPSIENQTVTLTYTHPHATVPSQETKTIKFHKVPAGTDLILMQLEDGDYAVIGEV